MELEELEEAVIKSLSTLDICHLSGINAKATYSYDDKEQFMEEIERKLKILRGKGIESMFYKRSNCKYCYPKSNTFSFFNSINEEFVVRYVIHQETEEAYKVEECNNRIIPSGDNGLPF